MKPKSRWASLRLRLRHWVRGWRFDWSYLYWRLGLLAVGLPLIFIYIIAKEAARSLDFYAPQGQVFKCSDYQNKLDQIVIRVQAFETNYDSKNRVKEAECKLGRDEILPYVRRSIEEISLYSNCPNTGQDASALVSNLKGKLSEMESLVVRECGSYFK